MFKGARIFAEMLSIFNLYRKLSAEVWRGTFYVESQSQAVNHPPTRRGDWLNSGGLEFSAPQAKVFWCTADG